MNGIPSFENRFFTPLGEKIICKRVSAFGKTFHTIIQLGKDPKDKIRIRISQPIFGPSKNDKNPHWRKGNKIYVNMKDLPSLRKHLNEININGMKLKEDEKDKIIQQLTGELETAKRVIKNLKEISKSNFKKKKKQYEKDLTKFSKMIRQKEMIEPKIQKFLEDKPLFFGLDYNPEQNLKKMPQKMAGRNRFDFFIERYDGQSDIVELKRPNIYVFNKNGTIGSELANAIKQTISYIEFCIHQEKYLRDEENTIVDRPKGTIVIGKIRNKKEEKNLDTIAYYFHHIEILTYEKFYLRAKNIFENAKKYSR